MSQNIQNLIDTYYKNYYGRVHSNQQSWKRFSFHFSLESKYSDAVKFPIVLELGAGSSIHPTFVKHLFDTYLLTDIREVIDDKIPQVRSGFIPVVPGLYKSIADARKLPYSNDSINRIVSGCLLLHLDNPLVVLEEWLRVLKDGGVIDTFIPNDQSLFVKLYRLLYSRRKARKLGFKEFDLVNAYEHHTYYERIYRLVRGAFSEEMIEFHHFPPLLGNLTPLRAYSIMRLKK